MRRALSTSSTKQSAICFTTLRMMNEKRMHPAQRQSVASIRLMATVRTAFKDKAEWLAGRVSGIGASEAASIVGLSPWESSAELWRRKTGKSGNRDLSDNAAVSRGSRMEPAIRSFYEANHPEMRLEYNQFDILYQEGREWLFATLDGELTDGEGRKGILEVKTAEPANKAQWANWQGRIPDNYYVQVLHQLLATGYDFVVVVAALYSKSGDITIREFGIERADADVETDMGWLLEKETDFWNSVKNRTMPAAFLTI